MWQNWLSGILSLWLVFVVFLGFSSTLMKASLVIVGLALAVFGFWSASLTKPPPKNPESEIAPDNISKDDSGSDNPPQDNVS